MSIIIFITFLVFGYFSIPYVDSAHDGIILRPVFDVLNGEVVYRDTFNQYGVLFIYIHAFFMRIFGQHVIVLRFTTLLFYCAIAIVLWKIYQRLLLKKWNRIAFLLWLSLSPVYTWYFHSWSSVQAGLFQCLSLYFFIRYIESEKNISLFFVSFFSVIAFWTRQPVGIFHSFAIICSWLVLMLIQRYNKQRIVIGTVVLFLGFVVGFSPVFGWLYLQLAIDDWWRQSIVMMIPFAEVTRGISLNQFARSLGITRFWKDIVFSWIWLAIPINAIILLAQAWRKKVTLVVIPIAITGLFSWHQYYPATDPGHFFWAMMPIIGLFVFTLSLYIRKSSIIFVLCILLFFFQIHTGFKRIAPAMHRTDVLPFISGIPMTEEQKTFYENTTETLRAYFIEYPHLSYINDSNNSFYSLFYPSHFKKFNGVFVNWGKMTSTVYPELDIERRMYVERYRPLVFSRYPNEYPDYCDMNVVPSEDPPIRLLIPKEIGSKLQHRWTVVYPTLRTFTCQ